MSSFAMLRSRAVQVEPSDLPPEYGVSGNGTGEPRGPKVYFRIQFGDKTLQFKLANDSVLRVLFSKMDVVGVFVWHGVVLDGELTPRHYGMKAGEENCVTLHVARDPNRSQTYAREIESNDVARAHAYQRRIAEDKAQRLEAELEQSQQQVYALHAELRQLTESGVKALQTERVKNAELEQRVDSLQQMIEYLQLQQQQQWAASAGGKHFAASGGATRSPPRYMQPTKSSSSGMTPARHGGARTVSPPASTAPRSPSSVPFESHPSFTRTQRGGAPPEHKAALFSPP
jgi:hypothetical protein